MNKDIVKKVIDSDPESAVRIITAQDPSTAYELIFEHADPPAVAKAMLFEDVYLLVKSVGKEDAIDLLEMLDIEKIQGFLDLDCWDKDRLSAARAHEWLTIMMEFSDERFLRQMKEMDDYLKVAIFKPFAETIKIEEPDENPFLEIEDIFVTPDIHYAVRLSGTEDQKKLAYEALIRIYRLDMEHFYWLLEGIYWETSIELEEYAYQEKAYRLSARGFPDYYSALEVFATVDPDKYKPQTKYTDDDDMPGDQRENSMFLEKQEQSDSLLRRCLAHLGPKADSVQVELMTLVNMVSLAHRLSFSDIFEIARMAQRVNGYLGIGIEHLAGENIENGAALLLEKRLLDLYKIGRSLVLKESRKLRAQVRKTMPDPQKPKNLLLDSPHIEFVEGILQIEPTIIEQDGSERFISNSKDLAEIKERIESIVQIVRIMVDHFEFTTESLRSLKVLGTNQQSRADVLYTQLFCTSFANDMLGKDFTFEPLSQSDCMSLGDRIESAGDDATINQTDKKKMYDWLAEKEGELLPFTTDYLESMFSKMATELSLFIKQDAHDIRYVSSLIIKQQI